MDNSNRQAKVTFCQIKCFLMIQKLCWILLNLFAMTSKHLELTKLNGFDCIFYVLLSQWHQKLDWIPVVKGLFS